MTFLPPEAWPRMCSQAENAVGGYHIFVQQLKANLKHIDGIEEDLLKKIFDNSTSQNLCQLYAEMTSYNFVQLRISYMMTETLRPVSTIH